MQATNQRKIRTLANQIARDPKAAARVEAILATWNDQNTVKELRSKIAQVFVDESLGEVQAMAQALNRIPNLIEGRSK